MTKAKAYSPAEYRLDGLMLEVLGRLEDNQTDPAIVFSALRFLVQYAAPAGLTSDTSPITVDNGDLDAAARRLEKAGMIRVVGDKEKRRSSIYTNHGLECGKGAIFVLTETGYAACKQLRGGSHAAGSPSLMVNAEETWLQRCAKEGLGAFVNRV